MDQNTSSFPPAIPNSSPMILSGLPVVTLPTPPPIQTSEKASKKASPKPLPLRPPNFPLSKMTMPELKNIIKLELHPPGGGGVGGGGGGGGGRPPGSAIPKGLLSSKKDRIVSYIENLRGGVEDDGTTPTAPADRPAPPATNGGGGGRPPTAAVQGQGERGLVSQVLGAKRPREAAHAATLQLTPAAAAATAEAAVPASAAPTYPSYPQPLVVGLSLASSRGAGQDSPLPHHPAPPPAKPTRFNPNLVGSEHVPPGEDFTRAVKKRAKPTPKPPEPEAKMEVEVEVEVEVEAKMEVEVPVSVPVSVSVPPLSPSSAQPLLPPPPPPPF
ncbi:hypothetical protein ScalyP_jg7890, partial [Parmales sp. scaly parma]